MEHIFVIAILNAMRFAGVQRGKVEVKRHPAPASQLDLFAAEPAAEPVRPPELARKAERALDRYFDGQAQPVAAAVVALEPPPQPEFDCWLHWPPVRSAWYLVRGHWTCAVCYPQL